MALNWGLGHICRMIPVIREFQEQNFEVIVGASPGQKHLLEQELPSVRCEEFPHIKIRLQGKRSQILSFTWQIPVFILQIIREHRALKKVIKKYNPLVVISDNCFGLWNRNTYCIFVTHQLNILLPRQLFFMKRAVNFLNKWFIKKFDECWVPDTNSGNIAGKLSEGQTGIKLKYIGILSRFVPQKSEVEARTQKKMILIILSGPEPQRTYLEEIIKKELPRIPGEYSCVALKGKPDSQIRKEFTPWLNYADSQMLEKLVKEAEFIICRSGYSTIMDLLTLGKTALLIPTPGQTEQEYLACRLTKKGWFTTVSQQKFSFPEALRQQHYPESGEKPATLLNKKDQLLAQSIRNLAANLS